MKKWIAEISNRQTKAHWQTIYADTPEQAASELKSQGWTVWDVNHFVPADPDLIAAVDRSTEASERTSIYLNNLSQSLERQMSVLADTMPRSSLRKTIRNGVLSGALWAALIAWVLVAIVRGATTLIERDLERQRIELKSPTLTPSP